MFSESTVTFVALSGIFAFSFYAVLFAGQLSLGQAGFASVAAFGSVQLAPSAADIGELPSLLVALAVGIAIGGLSAVVLGLPTMRLRGVFLAIATLGFAEAVRITMLNMEWTGGALGTPVPKSVTPAIAWIVFALVLYWFWRQGPSRYGRALSAIREDELAARSMGVDVGRHRLSAFVASGSIAGIYGVLFAHYVRLITPEDFGFTAAIDGLVTAVVGGSTVFTGPLLGGGFQTLIPELQRTVGIDAGWTRPFIASTLLLLVILFLPGGMASLFPRLRGVRPPEIPAHAEHAVRRTHPAPGEVIVRLEGVSKEYGGVQAVKNVDLEVRAGQVVGLIGPNGAGKTTLVNIVSGFVPPTSGTVRVLGLRAGKAPVHAIAAAGLSRTFQHSKLFNRLSALENVLVGTHLISRPTFLRRLVWLPSARRDEQRSLVQAYVCLDRVGLREKATVNAAALSYGDQRRLEIARALAADPTLLILDEPAAGMNHVEAKALSELIRSLASDGLTILFIEHNVGMILETCDHVEVLNFGERIASGSPADVAADPVVVEAYLGSSGEDEAAASADGANR